MLINPVTRQDIRFLRTARDTNGELLEMETTYNSHSKEPPLHFHPAQTEDFKVVYGELTVRMDGKIKKLKAGDSLHIAPNERHAMWNNSNGKTVVHWQIKPALNSEQLFETIIGLAKDGKTNSKGMPSLLQTALTAQSFFPVFRLAKPSFTMQRLLFGILRPIAHLAGYKATYDKYID